MSTVLLVLALVIGVGITAFLMALGLTGLGVLLSWIFPLTPFQGTLVHLILFSLAMAFMALTLLFERVKDTLWNTADEEDELTKEVDFRLHDGRDSIIPKTLPPQHEPAKIGRNDPCPCGSGKKYKFCCLLKR
jgi:SEC-C motif-containing protein